MKTLAITLAQVLLVTPIVAKTVTWDGGDDGTSWSDPKNWSEDALPTAADDIAVTRTTGTGNNCGGSTSIRSFQCERASGVLGGPHTVTSGASELNGPVNMSSSTFPLNAALVTPTCAVTASTDKADRTANGSGRFSSAGRTSYREPDGCFEEGLALVNDGDGRSVGFGRVAELAGWPSGAPGGGGGRQVVENPSFSESAAPRSRQPMVQTS